MTTPASMTDRGFALVAVLLVLGLLGLIGAEFAYSMRLEATAARTYKEGIAAAHLAEAGVEQAIRESAADSAFVVVDDQGVMTFYGRDGRALRRLPRTRDRKSTRLNSSHLGISYAVFCLKKNNEHE